jgi:hypothetical protein
LLIQKLNKPHNKRIATNPAKKLTPARCGITRQTINATTAMLHQGKYKHAAKLSKAISIMEIINFICTSPSVPLPETSGEVGILF